MKTVQYLQMVNKQVLMKQQKAQVRTLVIDFDQGTEEIEIACTQMVPEFGGCDTIITAIMIGETILGIILADGKVMMLDQKE